MRRDDSGSFLPQYQEAEIIKKNPFATIDADRRRPAHEDRGDARAARRAPGHQARHLRRARRRSGVDRVLSTKVGLNYVSCSPFRVPVARLAAAQAALQVKAPPRADCPHDHGLQARERVDRPVSRRVDPAWLAPGTGILVWVDIGQPDAGGGAAALGRLPLPRAVDRGRARDVHHPKIEVVRRLPVPDPARHRLPAPAQHHFATHDIDFFLGAALPGDDPPRQDALDPAGARAVRQGQPRPREGTARARCTASSTRMVDHYRPEVEKLQRAARRARRPRCSSTPSRELMRAILALKRDVASLRRVVLPQRDAVGRLARREFPLIPSRSPIAFATCTTSSCG